MMSERLLEEAEGKPSPELAERLIAELDRIVPLTKGTWGEGKALRMQGECFEALGSIALALEAYEKALSVNSKIGVKRRAAQLRKILAKDSGNPNRES